MVRRDTVSMWETLIMTTMKRKEQNGEAEAVKVVLRLLLILFRYMRSQQTDE